jgi:hypothetical protein
MAEHVAGQAGEPNRLPHEHAALMYLSQSWALLAWATEIVEQHGASCWLNLEKPKGEAEH